MSRPIRKPLVGVAYHQIAHYRYAVFDALAHSENFSYRVLSDTEPQDPTIAVVDPNTTDWDWQRTKNLWIGPFLWQRGLVREALSGDYVALIFLGNFAYLSTWIAALLARLRGRRVLFWTHGWLRHDRGLKGLIRKAFYRLAHALLVYGHWAKSIGTELGFDPARIHVVYNSLDYEAQRKLRESISADRLEALREQLFPRSAAPIAICSARLVRGRKLEMLVEAAARLRGRGRELHLLLVGDGPARPELEAAARAAGVEAHFAGACYDEARLAELTMAADVTVMPGSIGLTAIQSLAFGTPVITHAYRETQNPEWEAVVPGRSGDFFAPDDVEDLVGLLERWTSRERRDPRTVAACVESVERRWNPATQRLVIERALAGEEADDLYATGRGRPSRASAGSSEKTEAGAARWAF
jgi:glycosyltransferase involved in cell wall biosynthesis